MANWILEALARSNLLLLYDGRIALLSIAKSLKIRFITGKQIYPN